MTSFPKNIMISHQQNTALRNPIPVPLEGEGGKERSEEGEEGWAKKEKKEKKKKDKDS